MGLDFGGLTSLTKMFDPGNLVKQAVNSVLPKDMAVVGDVAGAIFDLNTGNPLGAAQLGMDAMKDLPQATKSLQQQQPGQQAGAGTMRGTPMPANPTLEPSAPPQGKPIDMGSLLDILKQLTALLSGAKGGGSNAGGDAPGAGGSSKAADTSAKTGPSSTSTSNQAGTTTTTTTTTRTTHETTSGWRGSPVEAGATAERAGTSGWRGEPRTPAPSTTTQATTAPATNGTPAAPSTPAASAPAASSSTPAASTPATSSTAPTGGETISSMAQLNTMSDSAIRDAVIHGRISPELAKDQTAMMAIQQRMNAISEMNNLMTNMMKALHDMQMAVVQNIRV